MPLGASVFEDVPLVEFMCLAFARMPGGVAVGAVERYYFPLFVAYTA